MGCSRSDPAAVTLSGHSQAHADGKEPSGADAVALTCLRNPACSCKAAGRGCFTVTNINRRRLK